MPLHSSVESSYVYLFGQTWRLHDETDMTMTKDSLCVSGLTLHGCTLSVLSPIASASSQPPELSFEFEWHNSSNTRSTARHPDERGLHCIPKMTNKKLIEVHVFSPPFDLFFTFCLAVRYSACRMCQSFKQSITVRIMITTSYRFQSNHKISTKVSKTWQKVSRKWPKTQESDQQVATTQEMTKKLTKNYLVSRRFEPLSYQKWL